MKGWAPFLALVALVHVSWAAPEIYLEDSHAGSFYWIAAHVSTDEPVTLVLFDAHSDATALPNSGSLSERLAAKTDNSQLLDEWRKRGEISCDAWIEPLMPSPINEVVWIPALQQDDAVTARQEREARALLTAHEQVSARDVRAISEHYRVADLTHARQMASQWATDRRVVVSIDLDFFAELEVEAAEKAFDTVWQWVVSLDERLMGVTFAVSRPWLKSATQASSLVELALRHSLALRGTVINLEPFAKTGPDSSSTFKAFYARGETPPTWNPSDASPSLRSLILNERHRLQVHTEARRWNQLLDGWDDSHPQPHLCLIGRQPGVDEIWRTDLGETFEVGFDGDTLIPPHAKQRWFIRKPSAASYNLAKHIGTGKLFAAGAGGLLLDEKIEITTARGLPTLDSRLLAPYFDKATGWGLVQVFAEVQADGETRCTEPIAIVRRRSGNGLRSAVSEGFGLPYVFGATFLREGDYTGPETLIGADCANFIIAGMRKTGRVMGWGAPADLRRAMRRVPRDTTVTEAMMDEGVVIDFDTHMTLLMRDCGKTGVIDEADIVAHHLEGFPALVSIGDLMRQRGYKTFEVLLPTPPRNQTVKLLFGGDVMLGRTVGERPFEGIAKTIREADFSMVNLECVISSKGQPVTAKPYLFRAPTERARSLREAGIGAVSLANNHAMDFGAVALEDMSQTLRQRGIAPVGAGLAPVRCQLIKVGNLNVAFVGMSDVSESREIAKPDRWGVSSSRDIDAVRAARKMADTVVVFMHWGVEGHEETTAHQRALARQLVDAGADIIVGAHPHCLQPLEVFGGRPVVFSLGNLVFDGGLPGSRWNQGALFEVTLAADSGVPQRWRLIPVELDDAGSPHVDVNAGRR